MHFNKGNILVETTEQMIFYLGLKISKEFIRKRGRKKYSRQGNNMSKGTEA